MAFRLIEGRLVPYYKCAECGTPSATLKPIIVNHTVNQEPVIAEWCESCRRDLDITSA